MKRPTLPRRRKRLKVWGDFGRPRPTQVYKIEGGRYVLTHMSMDSDRCVQLAFEPEEFFNARYRVG